MRKKANTAARITFIAITVDTYIYIYTYIYSFGSIRLLFAPSMQYSRDPVKNATFHTTFFASVSLVIRFPIIQQISLSLHEYHSLSNRSRFTNA